MKTILIVEDYAALGALYQEELDEAGYHTLRAGNGREALELMVGHHPDLVVLDINMAGMDGFEVLERMTGLQPQLPVIINSGISSYQHRYGSWSAVAFVTKSSDLSELMLQVQRMLPLHKSPVEVLAANAVTVMIAEGHKIMNAGVGGEFRRAGH